jgi:hypothetical protein
MKHQAHLLRLLVVFLTPRVRFWNLRRCWGCSRRLRRWGVCTSRLATGWRRWRRRHRIPLLGRPHRALLLTLIGHHLRRTTWPSSSVWHPTTISGKLFHLLWSILGIITRMGARGPHNVGVGHLTVILRWHPWYLLSWIEAVGHWGSAILLHMAIGHRRTWKALLVQLRRSSFHLIVGIRRRSGSTSLRRHCRGEARWADRRLSMSRAGHILLLAGH